MQGIKDTNRDIRSYQKKKGKRNEFQECILESTIDRIMFEVIKAIRKLIHCILFLHKTVTESSSWQIR